LFYLSCQGIIRQKYPIVSKKKGAPAPFYCPLTKKIS
jgi:hypothetical protein